MLLLQLKKIATLVAVLVGVLGAGAWMLAGARPEPTATVPDPIPAKPSAAPEKDDERTRALTILEKGIQAAKHCARLEKMSFKVEDGGVLATFELQGLDQARIKGGRPNENLDGCINGLACTLLGPRAGDIYLETNEKDWKKPFGNQLLVFKMRLYALRVAQTLEPLKDAKTFELSALGEYPINKRPALAIRAVNLKHKVRPDLELYFDKESGLLIQCRFQTKGPDAESGNELQFEDYQEIKGIKTFTRVRLKTEREFPFIRFPSTKDVDFELKEIKTPDKFDDETFEIPAEAKK